MLEVPGRIRPYLRRAYSVADADASGGEVEFLVKTIGAGTAALERLPEGAEAGLLGPLGNAFDVCGSRGAAPAWRSSPEESARPPSRCCCGPWAPPASSADVFLGGRNARELSIRARFAGIASRRD